MTKIETNVVKPEIRFFENETENLVISNSYESTLDTKISEIESFMTTNSGKGKSDLEKDELYKGAQDLWRDYAINLKNTRYNFHLNRPQYKFLTDLILTKLEYDVNTVFFAIELTDMLASMKKIEFSEKKFCEGINEGFFVNLRRPKFLTEIDNDYVNLIHERMK